MAGSRNRPEPVRPTCPAHLSAPAKAEWKRLAGSLHEIGLLTQVDRSVLAAYCQAYGRWVEAERKLAETPALLKTPPPASPPTLRATMLSEISSKPPSLKMPAACAFACT